MTLLFWSILALVVLFCLLYSDSLWAPWTGGKGKPSLPASIPLHFLVVQLPPVLFLVLDVSLALAASPSLPQETVPQTVSQSQPSFLELLLSGICYSSKKSNSYRRWLCYSDCSLIIGLMSSEKTLCSFLLCGSV